MLVRDDGEERGQPEIPNICDEYVSAISISAMYLRYSVLANPEEIL
jgi:hypothetical protein